MSRMSCGMARTHYRRRRVGRIPPLKATAFFEAETLVPPEFSIMKIGRNFRSWLDARRTVNELNRLSNQTLDDIGLTRYDIRELAGRRFR